MTTIGQTDRQSGNKADDMYIYDEGCATEKQVDDRYHKLLLIQVICLAIMCIFQVACMTKLSVLNDQIRDQKADMVRYLNSSEISVMQHMENEILSLKYSLHLEKSKTDPGNNYIEVTK